MKHLFYEGTLSDDVKKFYELQGKIRLTKTFIVGAVVYHGYFNYYLHGLSLSALSYFTTAQIPSFFLGLITKNKFCPEYEALRERLQNFQSQLVEAQALEEKKKYTIQIYPENRFYDYDEDGIPRWVISRDIVYSRRKREVCTIQERDYHLSPGYFPVSKTGTKLVLVDLNQKENKKEYQYFK